MKRRSNEDLSLCNTGKYRFVKIAETYYRPAQMNANLPLARPGFLHRLTLCFAELAVAGLLVSFFAPTPFGCPGGQIVIAGLVAGWVMPAAGAWAVLANFTALWMCWTIIRNKRPRLSIPLTLLLPVTSPGFWKMLSETTLETWRPYAWAATLLISVIAALMKRFTKAAKPVLFDGLVH